MKTLKRLFAAKCETKIQKYLAVLLIVAIEVAFGGYLWIKSKPLVQNGFIAKVGKQYVVFWKDLNQQPGVKVVASLDDALKFAKDDLNLKAGLNGGNSHPLEHLWMKSSLGEFTLYWKTFNLPYLNHLSFNRETEAKYYEKLFKAGAYSPSPIGHAITLVPIKAIP